MDVLATQSQPPKPNQDDSTFSKKKKKTSDERCFRNANLREVKNAHSRKCPKIISSLM
ncbi:hypothetical protein Golax_023918 [Gossypium laxum]|uniref:Uncharacterized protein n=1 Tax=Gossypium laxum TaxID=34288 RepID=A0A7J8ZC44_9ROSI|nr:hypothetical protein [Gossypium laxum]